MALRVQQARFSKPNRDLEACIAYDINYWTCFNLPLCSIRMCMHTNCIAPIRHCATSIFLAILVVIVSSSLLVLTIIDSITRYYISDDKDGGSLWQNRCL